MKKSLFGFDENLVAAVSCLFTCFTGLPVLILERENKFVRFHAMQATLFGLAMLVLSFALGILAKIPIIGFLPGFANWIVGVIWLPAAIFLAFMAFKGQEFKLPVIGDISWEQVNK